MDADALLHPRGPLPPATYWQRRAITVLATVLVLFVIVRACGGNDDREPTSLTAGSPSPTASAAVTPARTTPTPTQPVPSSPKPSPSPTSARVDGEPCRDADLAVTATANAKEYAAGARPRLTLVVTNRATVSCTRDLGAAVRELRVVSGTDRVWSSDDCAPGGEPEMTTLPAGGSKSFAVTWSRTRSRPGCPAGREPAAAGTYRVIARLGSIERPGDVFTLKV
ncbi:MAG TPA: hypothetical protein VNA14_06225 [Mycobacteriales bacterium]|nr:hypothetical protein [Mycobacteriales bacterium]